ncbi:hypothetical protein GR223_23405 [Rhizobium leguminosarum]|uniref:hypothetical protein n=1 Tax=Rhizobium ruizarguesonis TaxID=2081791 RepID=UPI0013E08034|nr:hypothetical protein [Rhizobium ruizarguesonis]NEJ88844.1 hypothetical protein [Rhizobium ruizarguesonis]
MRKKLTKPKSAKLKKPQGDVVPVLLRIERKEQYMIDVIDGRVVPDDLDKLRSLTKVRDWEDPSRGIIRIGSPNQFVTTHEVYGTIVSRIENLVGEINGKFPRKKGRAPYVPLHIELEKEATRADVSELNQDQMREQWSEGRERIKELESEVNQLKERVQFYMQLSAERALEIAKLQKSYRPLRLV